MDRLHLVREEVHRHIATEALGGGEVRPAAGDLAELLDELDQQPVPRHHERVDQDPRAAAGGHLVEGRLQDERVETEAVLVDAPIGQIDRRRVAEVVFEDAEQKRRLESLVHPLIVALQEDMISAGTGDPKVSAIILDSPLLLESNLDRLCHAVVFVEVSQPQRLRRLRESRGWDIQELRRRERWQMPLEDKRARSRFTISNEGTIEQLRSQIKDVFEQVLTEYSTDQ